MVNIINTFRISPLKFDLLIVIINNIKNNKSYYTLIEHLKKELYDLKKGYGNTLTLEELRIISDSDFGGLESSKKK